MSASGRIAGIILAAGGSARMGPGRAKQLLVFEGQTLLRRAAEAAEAAGFSPVIAVLGDDGDGAMRGELSGSAVEIVDHPGWRRGMGGSIRAGMQALTELAGKSGTVELAGVALMLCDQPLVTGAVLRRLVAGFDGSERALCAAHYDETVGVPAIFGRGYFSELRSLPEDQGAKGILRRGAAERKTVPVPEAAVDIDDVASYQDLVAGNPRRARNP